eukprot:2574457-Prymnesium_polylepis.1
MSRMVQQELRIPASALADASKATRGNETASTAATSLVRAMKDRLSCLSSRSSRLSLIRSPPRGAAEVQVSGVWKGVDCLTNRGHVSLGLSKRVRTSRVTRRATPTQPVPPALAQPLTARYSPLQPITGSNVRVPRVYTWGAKKGSAHRA